MGASGVSRQLKLVKFRELSLDDRFFDSLKIGYAEFPDWFARKANENVYAVVDDNGNDLSGMIYLKHEEGEITEVDPPLDRGAWLKVGTLKIVGRGTRLGERVIKKIFDAAIAAASSGIYVTVFELHEQLIELFERYGFVRHGRKTTNNGTELVLVRFLDRFTGDRLLDYPFIHIAGRKSWLLAVYPEYHTKLLPDSILRGEPAEVVQDVSFTNTIHKVYIGRLALGRMSPGDVVVIYRTTDQPGRAYYRSVVTSLCVVEEVKRRNDFKTVDEFLAYTKPRSVFSDEELRKYWDDGGRVYVAKMTYNVAFGKRTTRGGLLDSGIMSEQPRWDLRELSRDQFDRIAELGEVNARLIVD